MKTMKSKKNKKNKSQKAQQSFTERIARAAGGFKERAKSMNSEEKAEYRHYNTKALDEIAKFCINFDVLVMDEAVCAVDLGLLSEEKLVKFVKHKPRGLEIVMTGHHMTDALFECADYVTEMTKVKHPYDTGRSAREGIEF